MNKLTVCMFSNLYFPVVSGSATQTIALSRELSRRGHKIIVITARIDPASPEYEDIDGVSVYRLPAVRLPKLSIALNFPWLNSTFFPSNIKKIESILRKHKPDVLHLHNHMFDLALSAVLMRRRLRISLVTTLHTVIRHSQPIYNLFLFPADRVFLKHVVIDQSDLLIYPDTNIKRYALEAFGRRNNASVVPYGIDFPEKPKEEKIDELRDRFGLEGKRIILSLGHVHEIRNRHDLIAAMPIVLRVFPDTVLLIVGAISTPTPEHLVHKVGVEHSVIFAGAVSHEFVPGLLALASLEAHWLDQEEPERTSLGIASLEAMAAAKVIMSTANPNTYGDGILQDGKNFIHAVPGKPEQLAQEIISLLGDEARCQSIGATARETIVNHFSWDSVCERTLQVYQKALQKRG